LVEQGGCGSEHGFQSFHFPGPRNIPIKWRPGAAGATAVSDISLSLINISSIMVGNVASIMNREARVANAD
jgi:hypothetical protein